MSLEKLGKIYSKKNTEQVTDTFKKREFVLEVEEGEYTQYLKFELLGDNVTNIDGTQKGDLLNVTFDIRGRLYQKDGEEKVFNSLVAWKIERGEAQPATASTTIPDKSSDSDDLPF